MSSITKKRQIVEIDEALCNGCGRCVSPCAEGAIQIIDGKAKVVQEELCDGAGFCLGVCPEGALTIKEREAPEFDEAAARKQMDQNKTYAPQKCYICGNSEDQAPLIPVRTSGQSTWTCTRCLPSLIHG